MMDGYLDLRIEGQQKPLNLAIERGRSDGNI